MNPRRNPFVLGKPIREPGDFYGRQHELTELFESIVNQQPVALVGEHRCGNTSILYQLLNADVRSARLPAGADQDLLVVYVNAQLATEGPESLYRRIARALRRADADSEMDFGESADQFWIEDYLEDLADRDKRLVLLLDEFDVVADFESSFWEWFRGLITEYDMSIVVASRVELGSLRDEWGIGSPFFNMFRTIYVGSMAPAECAAMLAGWTEATGFDLTSLAPAIYDLGGRLPYYLQVAAALLYEVGQDEEIDVSNAAQLARIGDEYRRRVAPHFEDTWSRLPAPEREALAWLAVGANADDRDAATHRQVLPTLERRGYVVDGRIFSSPFRDFILRQTERIELNVETGEVRIERRLVELPPKEFALLRFLLDNQGEVVTKDEIAMAVWPEYQQDTLGVTDAMIQKTISRLRKEVDIPDSEFQHVESVRGQGYRFQNASVYEVYDRAKSDDDKVAVQA
jgi:DNA-binding winged helix-turn-helix (wHTH) protein